MNIIQVNNCDLLGERFNGHKLHLSLRQLGHTAYQCVLEKQGKEESTVAFADKNSLFIRSLLQGKERELGFSNMLYPFGKKLMNHHLFKEADIVHYHLIHNQVISLLDIPTLFNKKSSVWTIHDPWLITGQCIHPIQCQKWKEGCIKCERVKEEPFPLSQKRAEEAWRIKKQVYSQINPDIIVSNSFMADYIQKSPLTQHFNRVHIIPFGIKVDRYQKYSRRDIQSKYKISSEEFVIGFRAESNRLKGLKYIVEMLNQLSTKKRVVLLSVGMERLPNWIKEKYKVIELGNVINEDQMVEFYQLCNVFLMPSLAESFGVMAIEAMAAGKPVVIFKNTELEQTTFAPRCGISVPYEDVSALTKVVERLIQFPMECEKRGTLGTYYVRKNYSYEKYVEAHIKLYEEILKR